MKRFLFTFMSLTTLSVSAMAAYKCVDINDTMACYSPSRNGPEWSVVCNDKTIKGVAGCAYTRGGQTGERSGTLQSSLGLNTQCWCKLVVPAVTPDWLFVTEYESETDCLASCSYGCGRALIDDWEFMYQLYASLAY